MNGVYLSYETTIYNKNNTRNYILLRGVHVSNLFLQSAERITQLKLCILSASVAKCFN